MDLAAQAAAFGLSAKIAARLARAVRPAGPLEVLPDNWAAVRVFTAMGTQWRRAGMSGVATGLEYAALPAVCAALGVTLDDDLLSRVQVIERSAITTMLEKR